MGGRCWGLLLPAEECRTEEAARDRFVEQVGRHPDQMHGPAELHGPFWWMGWVTFREAQKAGRVWFVDEYWLPLRLQSLEAIR